MLRKVVVLASIICITIPTVLGILLILSTRAPFSKHAYARVNSQARASYDGWTFK